VTEDKFSKDINFNKVVFLHVNRILMCIGDFDLFCSAIEGLEDVLSPYFDDRYYEDLDGKRDGIRSLEQLDPSIRAKKNMIASEVMRVQRLKFRALMKLAERKNLLLEKTSDEEEWNLVEENVTNTGADVEETAAID
jgi:hypothetical protein